ncbi:MAG TPA: glycoside hydrolase family 3 N-terminal domain-containing protein [Thermoleophilaceae bacterium]
MARPRMPHGRPWIVAVGVIALIAAAIALPILLSGGADSGPSAMLPEASGQSGASPQSRTSFLSRIVPPPPQRTSGPPVPRSVLDLAKRLPLERKVAQLFLLGFDGKGANSPIFRDMRRLDVGGIVLRTANYSNPAQLAQLTNAAASVARRHGHVPPWIMAAQDGGDESAFADLPPDLAPAEEPSAQAAGADAAASAVTLRRLGLNAVLGPDLDVASAEGTNVMGDLTFGANATDVAQFARATVSQYTRYGVLTAVKHFPGLGLASQSPDDGPAQVGLSLDQLAQRDLVPFRAAFAAGAQAVLVGSGLYASDDFVTPASQSPTIIEQLLRGNLKFRGVAIADDLEQAAISDSQDVSDAAIASILAGIDMVYISGPRGDQDAAYTAVLNAVRQGRIPESRIDEAVLRVLQAKVHTGLIRSR